jgi:hypothetical protein
MKDNAEKTAFSAAGLTSGLVAQDGAAEHALACARFASNPTGLPDRQFAQTKIYATAALVRIFN